MQKIAPCLWFKDNAEEAMNFYTSVFKDGKVVTTNRVGDAGPGPKGSLLVAIIELKGQEFMLLNGNPSDAFNMSVSFKVDCKDQAEVDYFWSKLSEGGETSRCGWLKDQFGVWWQIVPVGFMKLLGGSDPEASKRAMQAMMKMDKLDMQIMQDAYDGK